MKKLTVGLTINPNTISRIWGNGINQNIAFLALLLRQSPIVGKVFLLHESAEDTMSDEIDLAGNRLPVFRPDQVTHDVDLVIEMGALMNNKWVRRIRALGTKVVVFQVGHHFALAAETIVFGNKNGVNITEPDLRNEIWTLPEYMKSCAPMLRTLTRRPVVEMPHLWHPCFLEEKIRELGTNSGSFGFDPATAAQRPNGWKVGIFEPNISFVKNCFLPMLSCEHAYRIRPEAISGMLVFNSHHMGKHETFLRLALQLDLKKDNKAWFESRHVFSDVMASEQIDAVVSHQTENEQNYLYYDALHGGYPLIHNSGILNESGVGFFYRDFRAEEGGDRLLEAWSKPPDFWSDYKRDAASFLTALHPENPVNVGAFTERIRNLMEANQ